jgi:dihydroorotate dehydrogenase electron transfer subunit
MQEHKIVTGIVRKNAELADEIFEMRIGTDACKNFVPGQFINIYLDDKSMLLPRPISICSAESDSVTIIYKVVGQGTKHLAVYSEKQKVKISTPLGNGYNIEENYGGKTLALVAGGIGIPPMIGLAQALKERNANVSSFLGFQSQRFLVDEFKKLCDDVFISTDDGSFGFHGNVIELLKDNAKTACAVNSTANSKIYDEYFSCGPKVMLKALSEYTTSIGRNVQVSIEERMGCGYGACVGCACNIKENGTVAKKSVCKDGPVFSGKDVVWDE